MRPFQYHKATSPNDALNALKDHSEFLGGGTNLVDLMKKHIALPHGLVDVNAAVSHTLETSKKGIHLGAAMSNTAIATHPIILEKFPLISQAILKGASPQIRNMATAAGNILQRTRCPYFYDVALPCNKRAPGSGCGALKGQQRMSAIIGYSDACVAVHPSDFAVALMALDAQVVYTEVKQGISKTDMIAFQDFHRLPEQQPEKDHHLPKNALITSIYIPFNPYQSHTTYLKLRDREEYAFALVSIAAALEMDGTKITSARLASGGIAHKPWRWKEVESYLKGKSATTEVFKEAGKLAASLTKPLEGNTFKVPLLEGGMVTALEQCLTS